MEEIIDSDGLEAAFEASNAGPLFLFKHSTTCPISFAAYREVEKYAKDGADSVRPIYLVKVIESRPVSNAIAKRTGVEHKSPQLILVSEGEAVWSSSHYGIAQAEIVKAVERCTTG